MWSGMTDSTYLRYPAAPALATDESVSLAAPAAVAASVTFCGAKAS